MADDRNPNRNPRLIGDLEKYDESFNIVSALLAALMFGKVTAARQLCEQLDAALKRIEPKINEVS